MNNKIIKIKKEVIKSELLGSKFRHIDWILQVKTAIKPWNTHNSLHASGPKNVPAVHVCEWPRYYLISFLSIRKWNKLSSSYSSQLILLTSKGCVLQVFLSKQSHLWRQNYTLFKETNKSRTCLKCSVLLSTLFSFSQCTLIDTANCHDKCSQIF